MIKKILRALYTVVFTFILFFVFTDEHSYDHLFLIANTKTVTGTFTMAFQTSARTNKIPVYEYHFSYKVGKQTYEHTSYAVGLSDLKYGEKVPVKVAKNHPEIAVIKGMSPSYEGRYSFLFTLIPIFGISSAYAIVRRKK